jgi:hypothetical protein
MKGRGILGKFDCVQVWKQPLIMVSRGVYGTFWYRSQIGCGNVRSLSYQCSSLELGRYIGEDGVWSRKQCVYVQLSLTYFWRDQWGAAWTWNSISWRWWAGLAWTDEHPLGTMCQSP